MSDGTFEYSVVEFEKSLRSSFIDENSDADDRYSPHVVTNDKEIGSDVLSVLKEELATCTSFDFSVAFITSSGVQVLVDLLSELERKNVPGRILTSTYLSFNDPGALRKLLGYSNVESRVFQGDLHAKGYVFDKDGLLTVVIGSSNLTDTALTCNREWNVLFRTSENGEMFKETRSAFENLWHDENTVAITPAWIEEYARFRAEQGTGNGARGSNTFAVQPTSCMQLGEGAIRPNKMQELALEALDVLHRRQEKRALLISATGTGKTYLSSFDIRRTVPKRVLFIAHRRRILEASLASFKRVLGERYTYGIYGGGAGHPETTCVFAMIGTLVGHLDEFDPGEFDYMVIDEAHRVGAASYQRIFAYFEPKFCLGMTATPARTDGYDVYSLFNHTIAYRITLQDALENQMLAPFHYFGIADLEIDDRTVDDVSLFGRLTSEERVRHIVSKIEEYTVDGQNRRGLVFCNRNEEAARLSQMFNDRGYRTIAISGATGDEERNRAISRLEEGEIEYIFSVDILNEGVDIPSLNQIIMLRRTESAIVFVQQLGRGLRLFPNKEYALILDFIGNYQQNFLTPIALSGDRTYNKDNLRKIVMEGSTVVPGASTISFDRVSRVHIFKSLEEGRFSEAKLIRGEYSHLKQILGRVPHLLDFDANESIDPLIIFRKYGSYAAFLQRYEPHCQLCFSAKKLDMLKFISQKLANGKRFEDLETLSRLISGHEPTLQAKRLGGEAAVSRTNSVKAVLSGAYSAKGEAFVEVNGREISLGSEFAQALQDERFRAFVQDTIDFGLKRNRDLYSRTYKDTDLVLNAKYTREEVCRLLRWDKEPNFQNIGGYFHDKKTNTFPVFINYDKDPSISVTTMYEDRFVSNRELIAVSKSRRTIESPEIVNLANAEENGMRCFLFVRKNTKDKDEGTEFYFLGEMHPTGRFQEFTMKDSTARAVEITYRLEEPVRPDLFDYFLSDFDGEESAAR